jgi:DHA3 family tetracycline resistance protein-like MFS transporter
MRRLNAYPVYLAMQAAQGFFFFLVFTVNLVYHATVVGLNPLQLVLVGTVLEGSVFFFEIPTGVVADVYSRRLSIIIGFLLVGLGFIVEGSFPFFGTVLLAQVIWGIGWTFTSGAGEAWIADELSYTNRSAEEAIGRVYLRGTQFHQAGALMGTALSVTVAGLVNITTPIALGGVLFIGLALFLALTMPENGFKPAPHDKRNSWQAIGQTAREGLRLVRIRPVLISILAVSVVFGLGSEGFDRLWTPHLLQDVTLPALGRLPPIVWFGLINAGTMLLTLGAAEIARRRVDTDCHQAVVRALLGLNALLVVSVVSFGLTSNFGLALAAFWLAGSLRATLFPLQTAWINQYVESNVRATMISINSQAHAIGEIAGGPVVGAIGVVFSIRTALVVSGLIFSPALLLYGLALRGRSQQPPVVEVDLETPET